MNEVYIIGVSCTPFKKWPDRSFKDLTREAYLDVLRDAGMEGDGSDLEMAWFSNCGMASWGQANIRGQVCFTPLVRNRLFPERVPIINVEGGCASASMAFHGAWKDILSGQCHLSLAIGVEKIFNPQSPERTRAVFEGAIDQLDPEEWRGFYKDTGAACGKPFEPTPERVVFMDTYAMQAAYHMHRHGTTARQLAVAASKNHHNGTFNPRAQYRFEVSVEEVLADRVVCPPLTRAMCAPVGDGAAAALLCSADYLKGLPGSVRDRAVRVKASVLTGGKYRALDEPGLSQVAARKAYAMARISAADVNVAEVHDATSFCEIYQAEMLGFCPIGQGGPFIESGATALGGKIPINPSGGLVSKGHPIGATGLSMIYELCAQLRGEAGPSQVPGATVALQENGGGAIGFEEAVCSVMILDKGR